MKTHSITSTSTSEIFKQLHTFLGGELIQKKYQHQLKIDNEIGEGILKGSTLKGGLSFIDFDLYLNQDVCINLVSPATDPIFFSYCTEGSLEHNFDRSDTRRTIKKYQTGILFCKNGQENHLYFEKDAPLRMILITVQTTGVNAMEHKDLNHKLRTSFFKKNPSSKLFVGSYNLKIAEIVKQIDNIKEEGIIRNLLLEGYVHMILGLELQQHSNDISNKNKNKSSLNAREMEAICNLSKFIDNYPEKSMSIKYLCSKTALSPRKLQEGFKLMHDTTVTDYIRDVRITKAEDLLKNTDLNVSEVVYSIGITSRSYFSKIFKQKYDCSPKHYKDQYNAVAYTV